MPTDPTPQPDAPKLLKGALVRVRLPDTDAIYEGYLLEDDAGGDNINVKNLGLVSRDRLILK